MQGYRKIVIPASIKRESILRSILIVLLVLAAFKPAANAASLSVDMGKGSTGFGIGTDFYFGYALIGVSAKFITDSPWSYVQTEETLTSPCEYFNTKSDPANELRKKCTREGNFHDGDEWELFGKMGFRLPLVPALHLNTGLGLASRKSAELYVFSEEYCTYREPGGTCVQKAEYGETWGLVDKDYFMTFLGGLSFEMNRRILLNLDYHSRKGLVGGLIWRY